MHAKTNTNTELPLTMGGTTTTEPPPYNGQQPKLPAGLNTFYVRQTYEFYMCIKFQLEVSTQSKEPTLSYFWLTLVYCPKDNGERHKLSDMSTI